MNIVIFESKDGWRWRLQSRNNRKLATSEAYSSNWACWRAVHAVRAMMKPLKIKVRVK